MAIYVGKSVCVPCDDLNKGFLSGCVFSSRLSKPYDPLQMTANFELLNV